MVKEGDVIVMIEDAYSTFSEARQTTYWNVKVRLPDGSHKLAGLFESVCDACAWIWGGDTKEWTGHSLSVSIKTSKAGNKYIALSPVDGPAEAIQPAEVDVQIASEGEGSPVSEKKPVKSTIGDGKPVPYPKESIDPNDIPF